MAFTGLFLQDGDITEMSEKEMVVLTELHFATG